MSGGALPGRGAHRSALADSRVPYSCTAISRNMALTCRFYMILLGFLVTNLQLLNYLVVFFNSVIFLPTIVSAKKLVVVFLASIDAIDFPDFKIVT